MKITSVLTGTLAKKLYTVLSALLAINENGRAVPAPAVAGWRAVFCASNLCLSIKFYEVTNI